jgi:hypothetical protein
MELNMRASGLALRRRGSIKTAAIQNLVCPCATAGEADDLLRPDEFSDADCNQLFEAGARLNSASASSPNSAADSPSLPALASTWLLAELAELHKGAAASASS